MQFKYIRPEESPGYSFSATRPGNFYIAASHARGSAAVLYRTGVSMVRLEDGYALTNPESGPYLEVKIATLQNGVLSFELVR